MILVKRQPLRNRAALVPEPVHLARARIDRPVQLQIRRGLHDDRPGVNVLRKSLLRRLSGIHRWDLAQVADRLHLLEDRLHVRPIGKLREDEFAGAIDFRGMPRPC
jgi:hypothetical protein